MFRVQVDPRLDVIERAALAGHHCGRRSPSKIVRGLKRIHISNENPRSMTVEPLCHLFY